MNLRNNQRKKILIVLIAIALVFAAYELNNLLITEPLKNELIQKSFAYVQAVKTMYILPEQYQQNGQVVPEGIVLQMKNKFKEFLAANIIQDSDFSTRTYEAYCSLIDVQANHEGQIVRSCICKIDRIDRVRIDKDQASVTMMIRSEILDTEQKVYFTSYTIGFVEVDNQWKIITVSFKPMGI